MADRYEIDIKPATRMGLFTDRRCLEVTVWDRAEIARMVGYGKTRKRDESEARALAAKWIADWEHYRSKVRV